MGLIRKEDLHSSCEEYICKLHSNPNLLINGDFQVWQRGTSFNYNSITNCNIFTADRWRLIQGGEGATANILKTSEVEENTLTISGFIKPSGIEMALSQKLDYPLQKEDGKSYTLSLLYSSTLNAELCIREYETNNIIERIAMPSSVSISRVSFTFDSSRLSKKNNRVEIYISFGSEKTYDNDQINLSNIKLEVGSVATPFVPRLYGEELALCQRYYENGYSNMIAANTYFLNGYIKLVPKRVAPTVKIYSSTNHTLNKVSDFLDGTEITTNVSSVRVSDEHDGLNGIHAIGTDNGGLSTGTAYSFSWTADAEIY